MTPQVAPSISNEVSIESNVFRPQNIPDLQE